MAFDGRVNVDILHTIFSHLQEDAPTLISSATVCKLWRDVALPHVFARLVVRRRMSFSDLVVFLDANPRIASYVRHLTLAERRHSDYQAFDDSRLGSSFRSAATLQGTQKENESPYQFLYCVWTYSKSLGLIRYRSGQSTLCFPSSISVPSVSMGGCRTSYLSRTYPSTQSTSASSSSDLTMSLQWRTSAQYWNACYPRSHSRRSRSQSDS
ncbi:hypothetical protein L227DRAFT_284572 [Lentinus tigrinus ALCF2SS1-6]|uniref:F-box domain-containing protein n=1 Tax=Lentinus tigrinus ALCF2SS1-6 TaxID=1328759 RepID=A0A5C2RYZ8_9APHY|nr:hypothetical protein L227DRAFT_284572 [Lentinus tigrinus ALCF2SS1-6]